MKNVGTVVRGIRTGVIKEGDNLADILQAAREKKSLHDEEK